MIDTYNKNILTTAAGFNINKLENHVEYNDNTYFIESAMLTEFSFLNLNFLTQLGLNYTDEDNLDDSKNINIGICYRHKYNNKNFFIGGNVFYDYDFETEHKSQSYGIELVNEHMYANYIYHINKQIEKIVLLI